MLYFSCSSILQMLIPFIISQECQLRYSITRSWLLPYYHSSILEWNYLSTFNKHTIVTRISTMESSCICCLITTNGFVRLSFHYLPRVNTIKSWMVQNYGDHSLFTFSISFSFDSLNWDMDWLEHITMTIYYPSFWYTNLGCGNFSFNQNFIDWSFWN